MEFKGTFAMSSGQAMQKLESLIEDYAGKGVALQPLKRLEVENLLKNSIFSSTMLLNLINDLLDLAKIETSCFKLNAGYFDLFGVIEKSVETLDSQLGQKRIQVTHAYNRRDRRLFRGLFGDQHRYLQIFLNFLSNAVKFTPADGTIVIETEVRDKQLVKS